MFIPDKSKKTIRILIRINAGSVVRYDGTPLPKVGDGTLGDLVLPASSLIDEAERQELEIESTVELLPAHESVFVGLNPNMTKGKHPELIEPSDLEIYAVALPPPTPRSVLQVPMTLAASGYLRFAKVKLQEPLTLRLRSNKESSLAPCKCYVPVLNAAARSLNHALTLLSTEFETDRISHGGNVFDHVFFRYKMHWHSLNEARGNLG